jgi:hypothetical protein
MGLVVSVTPRQSLTLTKGPPVSIAQEAGGHIHRYENLKSHKTNQVRRN